MQNDPLPASLTSDFLDPTSCADGELVRCVAASRVGQWLVYDLIKMTYCLTKALMICHERIIIILTSFRLRG